MREGFILAKTSWSKFMGYSLRLDRILGAICAIVSIPAWAQFPRPCTDTTSIMLRECCPIGFDGSKCGEESRRGFCVEIPMLPANLTVNEVKYCLVILGKTKCFGDIENHLLSKM